MKIYTTRERIACVLLALVFVPVALFVSTVVFRGLAERSLANWLAILGLWGGAVVFGKIAATGKSFSFFELNAGDALGVGRPHGDDSQKPEPKG
jgi:hypothetical protein